MGKGLVAQSEITPGMKSVAIADIVIERAIRCAEWLRRDYRVVNDLESMHAAIEHGKLAVCDDGELLARCELLDVFIESSNAIAAGGKFAVTALEHRKHVVMTNAEADLIFGPYLLQLARKNGVVYSSCDGDQPVIIKRLVDEIQFWGFDLVIAGNIKGFLDRYTNPTKIIPEADKRNLDYRMATSYTDGTKLNLEMALVANALGLGPDVPGMHGPRVSHVRDVLSLLDLNSLWKDRRSMVEYVLGAEPKGGVFAVGYSENEYQKDTLSWFPPQMGDGPFYVFYRPYHLGHIESMTTVAAAFLEGRSQLQPSSGFKTNVYAHAKRDLHEGDILDGIGGFTCYGLIENCESNELEPGVPICLAAGMRLKRPIAKDERVLMKDMRYDTRRFDLQLYTQALDASKNSPA